MTYFAEIFEPVVVNRNSNTIHTMTIVNDDISIITTVCTTQQSYTKIHIINKTLSSGFIIFLIPVLC